MQAQTVQTDMSDRLQKFAIVGLMLTLMGVVMGISSPGLSDTDLGVVDTSLHLPVIITTGIFYLIILSRIATHPARVMHAITSMKMFLPIVIFCMASSIWSTDPGTTFRRASFLLLTTLVGFIIGADLDIPELGRLFSIASVLHIIACAVLFVLARHLLYSPSDPGSLKGLTTHKNIFGMEMGLAVLSFLLCPFQKLRALRWPLVLVAGALLVLSHSAGAFVATACALAFLPLMLISRFPAAQKIPLALGAVMALVAAGYLLVQNARLLPTVFSKDSTLSGRTDLWALILIAISHRPLLGYGFDAFWQGLQGDSLEIIRGVGWLVPTAHNGYLDLLLGMGAIGALLFAGPLLQSLGRAVRYLASEESSTKYFPIAFLIFWIVYNLNESALLSRLGIMYLVFAAIATRLGLQSASTNFVHYSLRRTYGSPAPLAAELPRV